MFESANKKEDWEDVMEKIEDMKPVQDSQRSIWTTWIISVEKLSMEALSVLRAMAILGQGGVEEPIVKGILEVVAADGKDRVTGTFRKVILKELIHGSSLIWRDEGEEGERCTYGMHRLVRRFILIEMVYGSVVWHDVYSTALPVVHEKLKIELEKEGMSFRALPDVMVDNLRELSAHSLALVHHHVLPAQRSEVRDVSKVEEIHWCSGMVMRFMGKLEEEAQVWEQLLAILRYQKAENRNRGIASSLNNLGVVCIELGQLDKALVTYEQSLEMFREIYGHNKPHHAIAASLNNLGYLYEAMGKLDKALETYEQSLEMYRRVHGRNKPHHDIAGSLSNLGNLYQSMGKLDKALKTYEQSLYRKVHGYNNPHHNVAKSLNNLGLVYQASGKLDKALETYEQGLKMYRIVHGHIKPHPDIALFLNYLGNMYQSMGKPDKALEAYKQSLEMYRTVHGRNKPHLVIAESLNSLGIVYKLMDKLDKALETFEQTLEMYRTVHGHNKPNHDIAILLANIGAVYHILKDPNRAAEFLEQSLEMLRILHGRNSEHPHITKVLSKLADVYEDQGRQEEATNINERNRRMDETSDGQVSKNT